MDYTAWLSRLFVSWASDAEKASSRKLPDAESANWDRGWHSFLVRGYSQ